MQALIHKMQEINKIECECQRLEDMLETCLITEASVVLQVRGGMSQTSERISMPKEAALDLFKARVAAMKREVERRKVHMHMKIKQGGF